MKVPYHSWWGEEEQFAPIDRVEYDGNYGFVMDLSGDIEYPAHLPLPDCIYTEAPFRNGYKVFQDRASTQGGYNEYAQGLFKIIWTIQVPVYLIAALDLIKKLKPDMISEIRVNHPYKPYDGHLGIWRDVDISVKSQNELHRYLDANYNLVYDPSCGYLSNAIAMPNCKFIFSDSNPKCISGSYQTLLKRSNQG